MSDEVAPRVADRREFLKKTAIVGAAAWTAPAVLSLPGGRAWAAQYPVCNCDADGFALEVIIPSLGIDLTFGQATSCTLPVGPITGGPVTVTAEVLCATASSSVDGSCNADSGVVQTLSIVVANNPPALPPLLSIDATVLTSQASASCSPCATVGDSSIASLTINNIAVNVNSLTCNNDVLGLGIVVFDEQTCSGDTLSVNALHVGFPSIASPSVVEVIVAHSQAGATNCPCTACSA